MNKGACHQRLGHYPKRLTGESGRPLGKGRTDRNANSRSFSSRNIFNGQLAPSQDALMLPRGLLGATVGPIKDQRGHGSAGGDSPCLADRPSGGALARHSGTFGPGWDGSPHTQRPSPSLR